MIRLTVSQIFILTNVSSLISGKNLGESFLFTFKLPQPNDHHILNHSYWDTLRSSVEDLGASPAEMCLIQCVFSVYCAFVTLE